MGYTTCYNLSIYKNDSNLSNEDVKLKTIEILTKLNVIN